MARVRGPKAGLEAVGQIRDREALQNYYLYYAVLAEFDFELKKYDEAAENYRHALTLTELTAERTFLQERLEQCQKNPGRAILGHLTLNERSFSVLA